MAEYIDKADLVKRLENRIKDYGRDCNSSAPIISRTYQAVLHMVENLPATDVVEVVYCKDCVCFKQSISALFPETNCFICDNPYGLKRNIKETDYCSYGERQGNK